MGAVFSDAGDSAHGVVVAGKVSGGDGYFHRDWLVRGGESVRVGGRPRVTLHRHEWSFVEAYFRGGRLRLGVGRIGKNMR